MILQHTTFIDGLHNAVIWNSREMWGILAQFLCHLENCLIYAPFTCVVIGLVNDCCSEPSQAILCLYQSNHTHKDSNSSLDCKTGQLFFYFLKLKARVIFSIYKTRQLQICSNNVTMVHHPATPLILHWMELTHNQSWLLKCRVFPNEGSCYPWNTRTFLG